jgi:uncharacterized protein YndB with AHSA1/START domain
MVSHLKIKYMAKQNENTATAEREVVITRTFNAPRKLVWKAWTEPEYFQRWWGPKNFTAPHSKIDFRVGGKYLYAMRSPEGKDFWGTGIFREIDEPKKIVYTDSFADEKGNVVSASHYGMSEDFPRELKVTVTFEEIDGKTKMTLRHSGAPEGKETDMMETGWNESFDKLARLVEDSENFKSIIHENR